MQVSKCRCLNSIWSAFGEMRQAVDRMEREISDPQVKQWFVGYRDGLSAAQERFRITQGECCCQTKEDRP
jgi:hypothetical protein